MKGRMRSSSQERSGVSLALFGDRREVGRRGNELNDKEKQKRSCKFKPVFSSTIHISLQMITYCSLSLPTPSYSHGRCNAICKVINSTHENHPCPTHLLLDKV